METADVDDAALTAIVVRHTHRIPRPAGTAGTGAGAARQFDAVLATAGFKLSGAALADLAGRPAGDVIDAAVRVLPVVREMAGDHRTHNAYFRDFPANVPDTAEFWLECLAGALLDPAASRRVSATAELGFVNLLDLPAYGRYRHTYEEMRAAHDDLVERAGDRVTVLDLGGPLAEEVTAVYLDLAGRATSLGESDLATLRLLAAHCAGGPQPEAIPVRENRALINEVRLRRGAGPLVDSVTDVLRLACALSGGDVTLQEPTRFTSFTRSTRRALLAALDAVVAADPAKLGDVGARREAWKRLGERLHAHEYPRWPHAGRVFAVARGERRAPSYASRVEALLAADDLPGAAALLEGAPGLLIRSADRLLRTAATRHARGAVLTSVESAMRAAPGRLLLSLREHLLNRPDAAGEARVFANRMGRGAVVPDARPPLDPAVRERLTERLDAEIRHRLPDVGHLVIDPEMTGVALPLSGKASADGLGVLPRGSVLPVDGEHLRFYCYWRENAERTDFDLSALLLDDDYGDPEWISYTELRGAGAVHSGDLTEAPDGATEFIDIELRGVPRDVIIPQVNVFSGEGFAQVAESFFGFMLRDGDQRGRPFEPRTVRMKSELRGAGRVALPLAFTRDRGGWRATWLHAHLAGHPAFNRVENNRVTAADLVRAIVRRRYVTIGFLAGLWSARAGRVTRWDGVPPAGPVTYIGLTRPDGLHADSDVYTPARLHALVPD